MNYFAVIYLKALTTDEGYEVGHVGHAPVPSGDDRPEPGVLIGVGGQPPSGGGCGEE